MRYRPLFALTLVLASFPTPVAHADPEDSAAATAERVLENSSQGSVDVGAGGAYQQNLNGSVGQGLVLFRVRAIVWGRKKYADDPGNLFDYLVQGRLRADFGMDTDKIEDFSGQKFAYVDAEYAHFEGAWDSGSTGMSGTHLKLNALLASYKKNVILDKDHVIEISPVRAQVSYWGHPRPASIPLSMDEYPQVALMVRAAATGLGFHYSQTYEKKETFTAFKPLQLRFELGMTYKGIIQAYLGAEGGVSYGAFRQASGETLHNSQIAEGKGYAAFEVTTADRLTLSLRGSLEGWRVIKEGRNDLPAQSAAMLMSGVFFHF